jgi:hypothetical protein
LEAQHFVDCLETGAPFRSDASDGASVVHALHAGSRSLREGSATSVVDDFATPA